MKRKYQQTVASSTVIDGKEDKEDNSTTTIATTIDFNNKDEQPLQQHRPHKKPSLIYPPLQRPRKDLESLAELIEEFDLNRYSGNIRYNALLTNFRSFIEGEKDNIRQSQKFKMNSFKNYKEIRSMSCRIHEQSTHTLSVLRSTVQRLQEIRIHEAEVESICENHKNENNSSTSKCVIEGSKTLRMKKLKEDGSGSESSSLTKRNYEDSDEDDDDDESDMA